jgi:hypothetical protein
MLAIFGGWLCILVSAAFGLITTQFLGLDHVEGPLPPSGVYGVPAVVVLWIALGTAALTAVPAGAAMFARDPSRRLYVAAAVMAAVGVVLLPDDLGRAYAAALIPGAALLAAGGWWTHQAGAIGDEAGPTIRTDMGAPGAEAGLEPEPAAGLAPEPAAVLAPEPAVRLEPEPAGPAPLAGVPSEAQPVAPAAASGKRSTSGSARAPATSREATDAECPWCSARIAAGAERCPSCGAVLTSGAELTVAPIPGVTDIAPELRAYREKVERQRKRPGILSMVLGDPDDRLFASPGGRFDPSALRPPSAEVRAEMERLDREIAGASAVGPSAAPATAPATTTPEATAPESGAAAPESGLPVDSRPASNT